MHNLVECGICSPPNDHTNAIIEISSVNDRISQLSGFAFAF